MSVFDLPSKGEVWVKKDNPTDLKQVITAYALEKDIRVPKGEYDIGTDVLEVTFPSIGSGRGGTFSLKGHGQKTIIIASGPKVFDVLNTAWITVADYQAIMNIEGLLIKHDCSNATDITLDLNYSHPWLRMIRANNVNATRQGTGVKIGPSTAGDASSSGMQPTITGVIASMYDSAWDLCLDHCTLINTEAYRPVTYGYFYRTGCAYLDSYGPMVVSTDADAATLKPVHFYNIGRGNTIHGFKSELPTGMTNKVFSKTTQATIDIFGAEGYPKNDLKDAADTGIHIYGNAATCKAQNWGVATGTGAQQTIAHGLAGTPSEVLLCESTTGLAIPYQSAAADATNIYVLATLNKTFRWRASL